MTASLLCHSDRSCVSALSFENMREKIEIKVYKLQIVLVKSVGILFGDLENTKLRNENKLSQMSDITLVDSIYVSFRPFRIDHKTHDPIVILYRYIII